MSDFDHASIDVEATLRLMDVADELKRQAHEREQLVTDLEGGTREQIRAHLLRMYDELDESVDPALVDGAIETFLAEQHRFRPPEHGLRLTLARAYIRRDAYFARFKVPVLVVTFGLLAWSIGLWQWEARLVRLEERRVNDARARLTSLIGDVREVSDVPESLATRAEDAYTEASRSLDERQWDQLEDDEAALSVAARHARTYPGLVSAAVGLHRSIQAVAREDTALTQSDEIFQQAEQYADALNVSRLEEAVQRLRDLETELVRDYRIVIVGGVWRQSDDDPNVRNYYLRVEAHDASSGQRMRFQITNEETGAVETVSEWAERVPKEVYDRIGADKSDNGLIDNDSFASKAHGFLTASRQYPNVGQITRW